MMQHGISKKKVIRTHKANANVSERILQVLSVSYLKSLRDFKKSM